MNTSILVNNGVSNSKTYFRKFLELCLVVTLLLSVGFLASCKGLALTSKAPSVPTSLTATTGLSNVTISWVTPTDPGANEDLTPAELKSISVIYTKSNSQTVNTMGAAVETITLGVSQTNVVISNLAPATDYLYTVVVLNSAGEASISGIKLFRTLSMPPFAPTGVSVTALSSTSLKVDFTAGAGADSHAVKWKVSTAPSYAARDIATVTGNSYTITGLVAGATYDVVVIASTSGGKTESATVTRTISAVFAPGAPTGVTVTARSVTELDVSFTTGVRAASHSVKWKVSTAQTYAAVDTATATSPYTITGLTAGTTYDVVVTAVNAGGTTDATAVQGRTTVAAPVAPGAPTGVSVTALSSTSLKVDFTGGVRAASHRVKWKVSTASSYSAPQAVTGNSHTITGLTASTQYDVVVTAVNAGGTTEATAVQGTTSAAAPVVVSETAVNNNLANTQNLGTATNQGSVLDTQAAARDLKDVINTYLVNNLSDDEVDFVVANLGTKYMFEIGVGDRRALTATINRFVIATSWNGIGTNAEIANLVLTPEISGEVYDHRITFDRSAKTIKVTDTHSGANQYGSIRSFKVLQIPAAPGAPTGVSVTALSSTSLKVDFTAGVRAASHTVKWKVSTASSYSASQAVTGTSHTITGLAAGTRYDVVVTAVNAGGRTDATAAQGTTTVAAPVVPGAPTGVTVTARSATELDVSFTDGSGAASHTVKWKVSTASSYSAPQAASGNSHTITGLTADTTYDVVVTAVNAGGRTEAAAVKATTSAAAVSETAVNAKLAATQNLGTPTARGSYFGNSAGAVNTAVTAAGTAVARALKDVINAYLVNNLNDAEVDFVVANLGTKYMFEIGVGDNRGGFEGRFVVATNWDGTGTGAETARLLLTPEITGQTYEHRVTLVKSTKTIKVEDVHGSQNNRYGSIRSFKVLQIPAAPGAPTGITVTALSSTSLKVDFTGGVRAASHTVKWKVSTASSYSASQAVTGAFHTITGLTADTTYDVVVTAVNAGGTTDAAAVQGTTPVAAPGAPTGVTLAALSSTSLKVDFTGGVRAASHTVKWKVSTASSYSAPQAAIGTSHTITGLTADTTYDVVVTAVNAGGTIDAVAVQGTTPVAAPGAPTGVTLAAISSTSLKVSFTGGTGANWHIVRWKLNTSSNYGAPQTANGTNYTITGLAADTTYDVKVVAVNTGGETESDIVSGTTILAPAEAPTGLTVTELSSTSLKVNFIEGVGATSHTISWINVLSNYYKGYVSASGTSHAITDLKPGTTYRISVGAINSFGPEYANVTVTTLSEMPTGVSVTALSSTSLKVDFTAGVGAASHLVKWKVSTASSYANTNTVSGTSHTITGLTRGATYDVVVIASTSGGTTEATAVQGTTSVAVSETDVNTKLANTKNLGTTTVQGAVLDTQTATRSVKDVINTYLVNNLNDEEVDFVVANLGTKYMFEIGVGDRRAFGAAVNRFVIATSWNGTGTNAETAGLVLIHEISGEVYDHSITFDRLAKTIKVTDAHSGANKYGSIRSFKVLQIPAAPGAPTGITVTAKANSSTELGVSFTAGSGAASHTVKWKVSTAQTYNTPVTVTGNSHTITGLTAGTTYDVVVTAVNAGGTTKVTAVQGTTTVLVSETAVNAKLANTKNLGATTLQGTVLDTQAADRSVKDVIDTYLVNNLNDEEVDFVLANLGTKYMLEIGVGDRRGGLEARFVIAANWNGIGTNAETANLALTPEISGEVYDHRITFDRSAKTIKVTDTHAGANQYGSIRSFKVLQIPAAPGAPTGITVTAKANSSTELDVSFTAGSGAASHSVKWKASTAQTYNTPVTVTGNSHTITGLAASTQYDVVVAAVNAGGTTEATAVQGTTTVAAPGAPTGITVTAKANSSTELDVSFTAGSGAASHSVKWKVSTAQTYNTPVTVTGNSHTITGLTAGTEYDVEVTAVNAGGTTEATAVQGTTAVSETAVNTKIANTQNLGSTSVQGAVLLTADIATRDAKDVINTYLVNNLSDAEVDFVVANLGTKYKFEIGVGDYRNHANTIPIFVVATNWDGTGDNAETASLALTPELYGVYGGRYKHKITFDKAAKTIQVTDKLVTASAYGSIRYFKVLLAGAPTAVSVTARSATELDVSFIAGTGTASHSVKWKASTAQTYAAVDTATVTGNSHTITGLTAGTTYDVVVTAVIDGGTIDAVAVQGTTIDVDNKIANTQNLGSTGAQGTALATKSATRNVKDVINTYLVNNLSDAEVDFVVANLGSKYVFEIGVGDRRGGDFNARFTTVNNWNGIGTDAETAAFALTPEVYAAEAYNHRITFDKSAKTIKVTGIHNNAHNLHGSIRSFKVLRLAVPEAPTAVVVDILSNSSTSFKVYFTGGVGATSHAVKWKLHTASSYAAGDIATVTGNSHTITGLARGTIYDVVVIASTPVGKTESAAVIGATSAASIPTNVEIRAGYRKISYSFSPVADAERYVLRWGRVIGRTYTQAGSAILTSVHSGEITGLEDGAKYQVEIVSINSVGGGSLPVWKEVTTTPGAPTGTKVSELSSTSSRVTFTSGVGATSHTIKWRLKGGTYNAPRLVGGFTYDMTGLVSDAEYEIAVTAINLVGTASATVTAKVRPVMADTLDRKLFNRRGLGSTTNLGNTMLTGSTTYPYDGYTRRIGGDIKEVINTYLVEDITAEEVTFIISRLGTRYRLKLGVGDRRSDYKSRFVIITNWDGTDSSRWRQEIVGYPEIPEYYAGSLDLRYHYEIFFNFNGRDRYFRLQDYHNESKNRYGAVRYFTVELINP